jgi:hypothetical protein
MAIPIQCPFCARRFQVPNEMAGKRVKCSCNKAIEVPAQTKLSSFLDEELEIKTDPIICSDPLEWAEAVGAEADIAETIQKRMAAKKTSNATLMIGVAGAVLAILMVIGVASIVMMGNEKTGEGTRPAQVESTAPAVQ